MAIQKIYIEQFLELAKEHPVIDVRSPGEYTHAHIPGSNSLPLFTDEERKIVGTAYKQQSREEAVKIGLDFFGPKMKRLVEETEKICNSSMQVSGTGDLAQSQHQRSKNILIYCWRGGMRSAGVAWLLDLYGFKVYTLVGGYKKFRQYMLDLFAYSFPYRVIGGYTGSGKTAIIKELEKKGELVIDLEGLAQHKGSAFGNIGMPQQPTQEMFENLLGTELIKRILVNRSLKRYHNERLVDDSLTSPIWLEDEAQRIGLVNLPNEFWKNVRKSPVFFLDIPFEERLNYLVMEYGGLDKQRMLDAIGRIREKLGGVNAKIASQFLEEGNTLESFRILLKYYDKYYLKALHNREALNSLLYTVECKSVIPENASQLTLYAEKQSQTG